MLERSHLIVLLMVMAATSLLGVGLDQALGVASQPAEELDWAVALDEV